MKKNWADTRSSLGYLKVKIYLTVINSKEFGSYDYSFIYLRNRERFIVLTNLFPMHPFTTLWKDQKTERMHSEQMG